MFRIARNFNFLTRKNRDARLLHRKLRKKFPNESACCGLVAASPDLALSTGAGGMTPLMIAAQKDLRFLVGALLNAGAFLTATDARGRTPLHYAVEGSRWETIRTFCENGADMYAMDKTCASPIGIAVRSDKDLARRMLVIEEQSREIDLAPLTPESEAALRREWPRKPNAVLKV